MNNGLDIIWEDGTYITDEEMKKYHIDYIKDDGTLNGCIHGAPCNWLCELCPSHQKVYPLSIKNGSKEPSKLDDDDIWEGF